MAWAAFNKNHSSEIWLHLARKYLLGSVWQEQGCPWRGVDKDMSPEYPGFELELIQTRGWLYHAVPSAMWALVGLHRQLWVFPREFLAEGSLGSMCAQAECSTQWGCWVLRETSSAFFDEDLIYNNLLEIRDHCELLHSTKLNKEAKLTLISRNCCFLAVGKYGLLDQSWSTHFCIDIPYIFSVISGLYN